ncbi:MAG: primosomal protein N' [Bacilli bacterium]|nr:primosomal protein N' [Bacilli bacterium]
MYANILIQYKIKSLDHTFTYHIPDNLISDIDVGMKVYVPFGSSKINGIVLDIFDKYDGETKDIICIISKDLKLNKELLELGKYIKDKYLCTLISAYQTMLPSSLKVNNRKESYELRKTYIILNKEANIDEYINNNKRAKKQLEIIESLKDNKIEKKELSSSSLNILFKNNIVKEEYESYYRINKNNSIKDDYKLTDEQEKAYKTIKDTFNTNKIHLLHGITGSGKTEVYMHLCKDIIKEDKRVIILVPEISLTTQLINRFYDRYGNDVAIFHSELSDGEKYDEYKKIYNGEVHIVVGTRSAIFAPVNNLGLIIIDEEHTSSYKQENNPRYNAIDIAKWRCEYNNCPLVLGSATPTLESMARAQKGVYNLITMNKRVGDAKLPVITVINMQEEYRKRNMILSDDLKIAIDNRLKNKEQIMLLLNRRGYSTFVTCESCGYTYKCPHCDITLTYHKTSNNMRCHYCGYTVMFDGICPECKNKSINSFGLGTEKVENLVKELFPSARVVRMDRDTTTKKGSHEKIIKGIENLEYDIIIGTQMISKGLDFPRVTLVGIVNADESLNIPDFRSGENTYALLSQVSGRAGRANLQGEVIIQTFNPDNKTIINVKNNNYLSNYEYEMNIRKLLKYPPYYYLIGLKVISKDYDKASKEANKIINILKNNKEDNTIVLGPTTASQFKLNNLYRFQIIIKYKKDNKILNILKEIDYNYINDKDIYIEIDVDPIRF